MQESVKVPDISFMFPPSKPSTLWALYYTSEETMKDRKSVIQQICLPASQMSHPLANSSSYGKGREIHANITKKILQNFKCKLRSLIQISNNDSS